MAHIVLHAAPRAGCEASEISGVGLGLLRMACMATIHSTWQERLPWDPRRLAGLRWLLPLWSLSYYVLSFIRNKVEGPMEFGFQRLFTMNLWRDAEWMRYQCFYNLISNLTGLIVKEYDWQSMIDAVWDNPQLEDYNGKLSFSTISGSAGVINDLL